MEKPFNVSALEDDGEGKDSWFLTVRDVESFG